MTTEVEVTGGSNEVVDVVWLLTTDEVVVDACDRVVNVITGATDGSTEQPPVNKNRNATMSLQKVLTGPALAAASAQRDG